ncbi:MAG TPA: hypothetical protein VGU23_06065 [Acidobacteriaceae bacterium]|nr:hypothetical protein [Acidobacteriaceae bacterium]
MRIATRKNFLLLAATAAPLLFIPLTAVSQPATQLQPYTATDQSASAGVPSGWQVTRGQGTIIQMTGPQSVTVSLGNGAITRNAPFQLGQKPANGVDFSMPYSAPFAQKFTMILEQSVAAAGKPVAPITIESSTPIQVPPTVGQCGRIVASFTGQQGAMKLMATFCSLPLDSGGVYKNIMLLAQAPAATAAQAAPVAQAIFRSYRIPPAWLQSKLAPFTAPPVSAANAAAEAAMINRSTALSAAAVNNSANCFDLTVLRETPAYQLPRSCGGLKPD